jgi:hypothetical protein
MAIFPRQDTGVCVRFERAGPARSCNPRLGRSFAAVFGKKSEQRIHGFEFRRVDDRASVPVCRDQSRHAQAVEMKGEHTWRELESAGNLACRHTLRSGLHQEAKDVETIILR